MFTKLEKAGNQMESKSFTKVVLIFQGQSACLENQHSWHLPSLTKLLVEITHFSYPGSRSNNNEILILGTGD